MPEIAEGIRQIAGTGLCVGAIVAKADEELSHELIGFDGDVCVVRGIDGEEKRWPISEVFDVNELKRVAVQIRIRNALQQREHFKDN